MRARCGSAERRRRPIPNGRPTASGSPTTAPPPARRASWSRIPTAPPHASWPRSRARTAPSPSRAATSRGRPMAGAWPSSRPPRGRRPTPRAADPMVITRYLYKPDASEGLTRFNDNRRRHIFLVDLDSGAVSPLTKGDREEHSIDWSPDGREIAFVSSAEPDPDLFYNPDLFAIRVADGVVRQVTATESAEYQPRWSPDGRSLAFLGTRRGLTDLETTMEDTHVWVVNADGSGRRELGAPVDNRQGSATWSPDGRSVYCTVQERGTRALVPASPRRPARVGDRGRRTHRRLLDRAYGSGRVHPDESERPAPALSHRPGPRRQGRSPNHDGRHGPCAAPADRPERGGLEGRPPGGGGSLHLRQQRLQVRGGGLPDQAGRA